MRICIVVDGRALRHWQAELASRLQAVGHDIAFERADAQLAMRGVEFVSAIERFVYDVPDLQAGGRIDATEAARWPQRDAAFTPELLIDTIGALTGRTVDAPVLTALCDGKAGEAASVQSLLRQRNPHLEIEFREACALTVRVVATGTPGLEESGILERSFDRTCERLCDLLVQCVSRFAAGELTGGDIAPAEPSHPSSVISAGLFSARTLSAKVAMRAAKAVAIDQHWSIGWRKVNDDAVSTTLAWPNANFRFLPDDAHRFFADPFVVWRDGRAFVFCEEYPYATGKGIISLFEIGPDGEPSPVRPIIERPYHLSYPFVFERDGEMWMIPETSQNRTVELWRATRFPDAWTLERVLIEDVNAGDVTLIERDGLFWIFAALSDGRRSTWDTLGLFYASRIEGPWTPHPANPVLIDAGCARPAGAMFERNGVLIRPAQDCRGGYGAALALCRVDRLDPKGFAQTPIRRFGPPSGGWRGLHTLNRAGPIEVIDTKGWRRRF